MFDERTRERERKLAGRSGAREWLRLSIEYARSLRFEDTVEAARRSLNLAPRNRRVRLWLDRLRLSRGPWPSVLGYSNNACRSLLKGARQGKIAWSVPIPGIPVGTPVVGPSGRIFVSTQRGELVTVTPEGTIEHIDPEWDSTVAPTFDASGRLIALCEERGPLVSTYYTRFPEKRRPRPETLLGAHVNSRNGLVYASFKNRLYLIQGRAFRPIAEVSTPSHRWAQPQPAFDREGCIYVGSVQPYAGELTCLAPNGDQRWSFHTRTNMAGPVIAAVARDGVVARMGDQIFGFDRDGTVRWQRKTHVPDWWRITSGPALAPATLYADIALLNTSWGVAAVSVRSGKEVFQRGDLNTSQAMAVDRRGVFHISVPGRLVGIDVRGRTVYEVSLPGRGEAAGAPSIAYGGRTMTIVLDTLVAVE